MKLLQSLFGRSPAKEIAEINRLRAALAPSGDEELRRRFRETTALPETIAIVAVVASRVLSLNLFDVQLQGALALARGRIAEMQTGEGKTLACTPAVAWYARGGQGVHVMTVNDYLARRDARWMGGIYEFLGLSVGYIQQGQSIAERQAAYRCDITYATAAEIGFDSLRDQLALRREDQVHRPFNAVVIDEADSILIDEARIPLVLAGGEADEEVLARQVEPIVRRFRKDAHFTFDEFARNIALTDEGAGVAEAALGCGNLYAEANLAVYSAVHDAIHAHHLLHRDVDYVVKNGVIESVDELKGRIAPDRRWPAGLHTAVEAKEGVAFRRQGRVLGSMTLQSLVALYPRICGMTGTAATQAKEFLQCYELEVEVIPPNRPVIREDAEDVVFSSKAEKEQAVVEEIRRVHSTGEPILVGTASVEESERLSAALGDAAHHVLNARNEEEEAGIVAQAGQRGALTISTNMAGRGVDIALGPGVAGLGGLYVIGTNRHTSRRIDHQLRGRAGRQGDPGRSRFFISMEDDLLVKYGIEENLFEGDIEGVQRRMESQSLELRHFLNKYETIVELQRRHFQDIRQEVLESDVRQLERLVRLVAMDDLWADYLAAVGEIRSSVHWYSYGGREPLREFLVRVDAAHREMEGRLEEEVARRLAEAQTKGLDPSQRGATWTYLTTDTPFGDTMDRFLHGLGKKMM